MDLCSAITTNLLDDLRPQVGSDCLDAMQRGYRFWPGMSIAESAAASLWHASFKKYVGRRTENSDSAAIDLFVSMNLRCKEWTLKCRTSLDEELIGDLKRSLDGFFNPGGFPLVDSVYQAVRKGRLGPGVNIGGRNESFYAKLFASPLTSTDRSLYTWYKRYTDYFPIWRDAELFRSRHYGEVDIVAGSRISLVPKSDKISRLICSEPGLNMFFQLGLANILEARLRQYYHIDLTSQPDVNRRLALEGSVTGDLVTLDLSSASDIISLGLFESVFPREFSRVVHKLRSPRAYLPTGELHDLFMVSTMGNGFTFPLQTILFCAVVDSAFRSYGMRSSYRSDWSVFGDDIIVPQFIVGRVYRLLELIGSIVNVDKSFSEGPFRESCGVDFHSGVNVRGVYIKDLSTQQKRYSVINQLNLFSERTGLMLEKTVGCLLTTVKWQPVPFLENDDSGIRVPASCLRHGDVMRSKRLASYVYTKSVAEPLEYHFASGHVAVPRGSKSLIYNPSGYFISILQGSVNSESVSIRHDRVRYRRRRGVLNFWDRPPTAPPFHGWDRFWRRWETAVLINLNRL